LVGESSGEKIIASIGRFGPYIKKGDDFRSIPKDKDLFLITLSEAEAIFAEEKKGRGGRKKATILKDFGIDTGTGKPIQILDGKYGPYVSNGTKTFASVPKEMNIEEITLDKAKELLANKKSKRKKK
jgi:DNA topoisomerase-1